MAIRRVRSKKVPAPTQEKLVLRAPVVHLPEPAVTLVKQPEEAIRSADPEARRPRTPVPEVMNLWVAQAVKLP
jgi:hypothetical protein